MASLLFAAKWVRSAVCAPTIAARPALPEAVQLQTLGLGHPFLNTLVGDVTRRLAELSSLLDIGGDSAPTRHRFPAQSWK